MFNREKFYELWNIMGDHPNELHNPLYILI